MNKAFKNIAIIIIVCLCGSLFFLCRDSFAIKPINSIKSKAAFEGVWQCLVEGAFKAEWTATQGAEGLLLKDGGNETVKLPYDWTDATDNNTNCKQVLFGFYSNHRDDDKLNDGLIPETIQDSKNKEDIAKFYAGPSLNGEGGLGYIAEKAGDVNEGQETQQLYYEVGLADVECRDEKGELPHTFDYYDGDGNWTGNKINIGDKLVFPTITKSTQGSSFYGNTPSILTEEVNVPPVGSGETWFYSVCGLYFWIIEDGEDLIPYYTITEGSSSGERDAYGQDGVWKAGSFFGKHKWYRADGQEVNDQVILNPKVVTGTIESGDDSEEFEDYKLIWKAEQSNYLLQGINEKNQIGYSVPGLKSYRDLALTDQEVYDLYRYYLTDVYKGSVLCEGDDRYDVYVSYSYPDINWKKGINCKLYIDTSIRPPNQPVYGVDSDKHFTKKLTSYQDVVDVMNALNLDNIDADDPEDPDDPDPPEPGKTEITCANSAAAESLGWILCPLLNVLSNAANDIYNNTVEPMLQIQPELFSQDDNYGTKYAWDVFQNIANIIFVILFLFVIFSQLTGVGIDNYGIKKILPKLIIAAILVNLSYYICLICVDLSNIIGNGLQSMFDNLPLSADGMATSITIAGESGSQSFSIVPTAITGVALLGVLVAGIWAVIANPAILLSLLVSALGVVIAIFFLFILLSARQAAVIVLTVISPVAFVCYLLPNTKKLFDKYIQLGKGLLLLYPICGLLVGGGNYVSKLLLSSGFARDNGIAAAFTAMIIGVVPIFFIPSLLRSSFAVLGNLGAKISGFGERIRGGATRGIRNMEGYKRAQERGAEIGTRIRAGYDRNGNKRDVGRFGRFMRGISRRGMQREALRYQKIVSDRGSLEATEGEDFMLATETANEMKNIVASGEINDMGSMQNSLRDALESGDRAKIRAYTDGLTAKGEDGRVAVKAAYNAAVGSGRMSTDSARTFANNIMANHAADYKNNNRSMFEVARNINTAANPTALSAAASTTTGSYVGANSANLAGKVTATTIGNMDDDAFGEMFGGYNGNPVTIPAGASANEIGAAAYAALNDQNANIKAERRKYLEDLVKFSGYQAKVQNVQVTGGTVDTNVLNPVLNVQGTVDVGNEVDVNITQRRGGQVKPVQVGGTVDTQEAGIYADSAGNTYRIRKTLDGKYVDDAGFEVDISRFNPR